MLFIVLSYYLLFFYRFFSRAMAVPKGRVPRIAVLLGFKYCRRSWSNSVLTCHKNMHGNYQEARGTYVFRRILPRPCYPYAHFLGQALLFCWHHAHIIIQVPNSYTSYRLPIYSIFSTLIIFPSYRFPHLCCSHFRSYSQSYFWLNNIT